MIGRGEAKKPRHFFKVAFYTLSTLPAERSKTMTKFNLDTHPNKAGEYPIRVSVRSKGKRFQTTIGYSISPDKWKNGEVEAGTKKAPVVNSRGIPASVINARIAAIRAAFAAIDARPEAAPLEEYREALDTITGKAPRRAELGSDLPEVLAAFEIFVKEESRARQWTEGTKATWHTFRNHLRNFRPDLKFDDLTERGLSDFVDFLRTSAMQATNEGESSAPQGLSDSTAQENYKKLRWFLRWCTKNGYCNRGAFEEYRPKFKLVSKPVVFLTRPELLRLYNFEIPANGTVVKLKDYCGSEYEKKVTDAGALEKARDLFCFCAFTSLRYSDMASLTRNNISGDTISVTTQKTYARLEIPLNNYSRAILDKYAGYTDPKGRALPVIANQSLNYYLKDLCELCGLNEPVVWSYYRGGRRYEETAPKWQLMTSHAGRRTFICYALTKGIPPQVVMKFTGHSDYKAMKPYIDIAAADAAEAMKLMND